MKNIVSVVLAAGQGKRIKSNSQKIIHEVLGKPVIKHVIETLEKLPINRNIVVINNKSSMIKNTLKEHRSVKFIVQNVQLGTGHAVMQTRKLLKNFKGTVLVVCGDTPLLTVETLHRLITKHVSHNAAATILTTDMEDPTGYGRIIHNSDGSVQRIVEEKDSLAEHKPIKEINTGTYCFSTKHLFSALSKISNKNKQGEYYLTDVIGILTKEGHIIEAEKTLDSDEAVGINTRRQLAQAQRILRYRILDNFMDKGVTIIDVDNTFIDSEVEIGIDTVIYPFTFIRGRTVIGESCEIGPQCELKDVKIGNNTKILMSVVSNSKIENNVVINPFSYIGRNCLIKDNVRIETGTTAYSHDSNKKSKIVINKGASIGANSNIVAPVNIGGKAIIYPGSLINKDVKTDYNISTKKRKR